MLIHRLNSQETAEDKVPIAIGIGTTVHRWGLIFPLTLRAGGLSPHSTGKSNYLEWGTRRRSLWHLILFNGHSPAWFDMPLLQHSQAPAHMPSTMAKLLWRSCYVFSCGFNSGILIDIQEDFGRKIHSPSLHRTEVCGATPNTASKHNPSQWSPWAHDYPGNESPLIQHNLLPINPSYLLITALSCLSLWLSRPFMSFLFPEQSPAAMPRECDPFPTLVPKPFCSTESGPSTPSLIPLQNAPTVQLDL